MNRRLVFIVVGLAVPALVTAGRVVAASSGSASPMGEQLQAFLAEVRVAMAEREQELREALGLDGRHDVVDADL